MLAIPARFLGRLCQSRGGRWCSSVLEMKGQRQEAIGDVSSGAMGAKRMVRPLWLMRRSVRLYSANGSSSSGQGGFQAGSDFGRDQLESKVREMENSLPWSKQAKALLDFGLLFACFGFTFASSLRANHRQVIHDEEIEALNLELAETQEELQQIKSNWQKIDSFLASTATVATRGGQPVVSLSLLQELVAKELFRKGKIEQGEALSSSSKSVPPQVFSASLSPKNAEPSSLGTAKTNQIKPSTATDSALPRPPPPTRVILYQS